ncbi:WSC domain-containing protein 2-like [Haliotis rufescens]|uniref:WSC domain-containing protein 2-like n=1 Tax=Haliotis rufescens TaxID=6454 RepID=UPI00201EA1A9|nr:WSC domain-containing protein 2-like [Haliotis rufescens]
MTTTTTAPAAATTVLDQYVGCYKDNSLRILPQDLRIYTLLTTTKCLLHCHGKGYTYFGTQNRVECYCGNSIKSGYEMVSDDECSHKCAGDTGTMCGGAWRVSVYKIPVNA